MPKLAIAAVSRLAALAALLLPPPSPAAAAEGSWTPLDAGLGVARRVMDLEADPGEHFRIYAATFSGGVFAWEEE